MLKSNVLVCVSLLVGSTAALADGFGDYPPSYTDSQSTVTRAQVKAELALAQERGEVLQSDGGYPFATVSISRSRQEVQAELREAQRLGLVYTSDSGIPVSTPEQEAMIAKAGAAAAEQPVMAHAKR